MEAFGGGGRRRTVHFDLHGNNWAGGPYSLDDVTARGSYHEAEGLNLQQFSIQADDAVLLVKAR